MNKFTETKDFSQKEISVGINNALALAARPQAGEILGERLRRLSEYAAAVVDPCEAHMLEGLLSAEELVVVMLSCALIVHAKAASESSMPMINLAKKLKR